MEIRHIYMLLCCTLATTGVVQAHVAAERTQAKLVQQTQALEGVSELADEILYSCHEKIHLPARGSMFNPEPPTDEDRSVALDKIVEEVTEDFGAFDAHDSWCVRQHPEIRQIAELLGNGG
jgi:hypothetical protein